MSTKQADLDLIQRTSDRLYGADFLGRAYLADYVAGVQTLCESNERLRAEVTLRLEQIDGWKERLRLSDQENQRLRAAAQAVIDSINDENEIDPDAIFRLSKALHSASGT